MMSISYTTVEPATLKTKDFDYMPSQRNGRRKNSFSVLSGSRVQPFHVHPSTSIESYVLTSAKQNFHFEGEATRTRLGVQQSSYQPHMLKPSTDAKHARLPAPSVGASASLPSLPPPAPSGPPSSESHPLSSPFPSSPPPSSSHSRAKPAPSIEAEKFLFRFHRAAKLAAAAKVAIKSEAIHIRARIREEELILSMLRDEEEHTGSRMKTASHQLEVICRGAKLYGLDLPDVEEMEREALKSEMLYNIPSSPSTPPRTPPPVFHEDIVDAMNQSSGSLTHEPSHSQPFSGMSSEPFS